jgi:hypothetical protein
LTVFPLPSGMSPFCPNFHPFPSLHPHPLTNTSSIFELGLGIMALSAAAYRPLGPKFYGDSGTIRLSTPTPVFAQNEKSPAMANPYQHQSLTSGVQLSPQKPTFRPISEFGGQSPPRRGPLFTHLMTSEGIVPVMELGLNMGGVQ